MQEEKRRYATLAGYISMYSVILTLGGIADVWNLSGPPMAAYILLSIITGFIYSLIVAVCVMGFPGGPPTGGAH